MPAGKMRKVYTGRSSRPLAIASKALKLAKQNKQSIEVKEITNTVESDVTTAGSVSTMTNIAEGDDINNRTGRKVRLKSFQIKGYVVNNDSTSTSTSVARVLIIRDNSFTSSTPSITEILQGGDAYGLRAQEVENKYAYSVLYDKLMVLDPNSNNQQGVQKFKKLNHECIFDGSANTTSNKGALYLMLLSNRTASQPGFFLQTRVRFTDA